MNERRANEPVVARATGDLAVVFAVALVVRLAHASFLSSTPFFRGPIIDAQTYWQTARSIAESGEIPGPFFQPPLYPLFLSLLERMEIGPGWGLSALQSVMGATTCALFVIVGRALIAADPMLGRRVGLASGLIAALYGPLIAFDLEMLPPPLIHLLLVGAWAIAATAGERPGVRDGLAGACVGLATIGWVPSLVFLPSSFLLVRRTRRATALAALIAVSSAAVPIAFTAAHNAAHGAPGVLVSYNGGLNLWLGNNPQWRDTWRARPGAAFHPRAAEAQRRGHVSEAEQDRWFRDQALTYVRISPDAAIGRTAEKLYYAWHGRELRRNQDLELLRDASPVLAATMWELGVRFPFGFLVPLALLGLLARRHERSLVVLAASAGVYSLALAAIFVSSRYRLPMVLALIPLAAIAVAHLSLRRWPPRSHIAAALALLVVVSLPNDFTASFRADSRERAMLTAQAFGNQGDLERATAISAALAERYPDDPDVRMAYGELLGRQGRCEEAIPHLGRVADLVPRASAPLGLLASCFRQLGRLDLAERAYAHALARNPFDASALRGAATLYVERGQPRHAVQLFERLREHDQNDDASDFDHGRLLLELGRADEALEVLAPLLERRPDDAELRALVERARR